MHPDDLQSLFRDGAHALNPPPVHVSFSQIYATRSDLDLKLDFRTYIELLKMRDRAFGSNHSISRPAE